MNYFIINDNDVAKYIIKNSSYIKEFLKNYQEFVSNKYLYDKLNFAEKEYVLLIDKTKNNLGISFKEANELIYNTILFNVINEFERNNTNVINYISNFDNIRNDIRKNIVEKKELTKKLAFNELLDDVYNLDGNNKLSKIEEMCNRKRKMSINKFMDKYKLEMMDSIKIWLMTPEVVSDKTILFTFKNNFEVVLFDKNITDIQNLLKVVYNKKYDLVSVTNEDRETIKAEYIKNIKSGIKYEYIEIEEKKIENAKNTELQNSLESIFGSDYITM